MGKRSADSVMFGFDFQVNAAIVLMLEDIKGLRSIRLEGNYEDIELSYDNGEHVLAQAKSITDPINDFSNVHSNLKKALKTLSEGKEKGKVRRLIFITNSRNPFKEKINIGSFEGESKRPYSSLSKKAQDLVDNYLKDIENPLDKDKFLVHILPFETDIDEERYKIVKNRIDEFLSDLNLSSSGIGKKVMKVWQTDIFNNGTKKNKKISSKKYWLAYGTNKKGVVTIDEGAEKALFKGKSLLPVGIKSFEGNFEKGTIVKIMNMKNENIATGISNYSSDEIELIMGHKSEDIEKILGHKYDDVVVHIDNMVITKG